MRKAATTSSTRASLEADGIQLTLNGGLGDDMFVGSKGDDLIRRRRRRHRAHGRRQRHLLWNPGDDNDTIEGQAGSTRCCSTAPTSRRTSTISANGGRALFFRNIANVTMDMNDVERIEFNALGGADTSSSTTSPARTCRGQPQSRRRDRRYGRRRTGRHGDGEGTNGDDIAIVVGDASGVSVLGLAAQVNVTGTEAANDRIVIQGFAGDDVIEASGVGAGVVGLTLDGGEGDDVLIGGEGDYILSAAKATTYCRGRRQRHHRRRRWRRCRDPGFRGRRGDGRPDRPAGRGLSFEWLMAHASDVNGDTVLDLGDQQITLRGVSSSQLHRTTSS